MTTVLMTILVLLSAVLPSCGSDGMNNIRVDGYGVSVTLPCTDRSDVVFYHWVLPATDTLVDRHYSGPQMALLSNWSLHIASVEREDTGDYLCVVSAGDDFVYYKTHVYQQTPNVWGGYRHNLIVGGSAAAAALIVFSLISFFNARAHLTPDSKGKDADNAAGDFIDGYRYHADTSASQTEHAESKAEGQYRYHADTSASQTEHAESKAEGQYQYHAYGPIIVNTEDLATIDTRM